MWRRKLEHNVAEFRELPKDHVQGNGVHTVESEGAELAALPAARATRDARWQVSNGHPGTFVKGTRKGTCDWNRFPLFEEVTTFVQIGDHPICRRRCEAEVKEELVSVGFGNAAPTVHELPHDTVERLGEVHKEHQDGERSERGILDEGVYEVRRHVSATMPHRAVLAIRPVPDVG